MPRNGAVIVIIKWRDIPAQVNAQFGRERYQLVLSAKFQRALDRAKRKAHIYTAEEDVAQWSRESLPLEGTMEDAAKAMVERLEAQYSREHLGRLAYAGGWEKDVDAMDVSARELAALEELEEDE
jgi:hypothetical protein